MPAGRIPDDTIRAIRERIDLADLIGRYVQLKQAGRNWKGLCPFHNEKTPSFNVNIERQVFHCFGCGAGGDCFGFLMQHDNLSFREVVRALGRECGVEIPEESGGESGLAEKIFAVNERAQTLYRSALASPEGAAARAYLAGRGLDDATLEVFGVGFAPDRWDSVARELGAGKIPLELGHQAGLLAERDRGGYYDRLRGRVTFPIRDVRGRVLGFGGRALGADQQPKYLNTPESPVYRKRETFYGFPTNLEPMRRTGRAVVVEGYFDLVALHRAGIQEALATCGTALTEGHGRNLRLRTRSVVLLFDGDSAGRRAVEAALATLLPHGLRVAVALLPAGDDPDTYLSREGPEALRALVDGAESGLEWLIRRTAGIATGPVWDKTDAVTTVARLIARVPDPLEASEYASQLVVAARVERRAVDAAIASAREGAAPAATPAPTPARPKAATGGEMRWIKILAQTLLAHPALVREIDAAELRAVLPEGDWSALVVELLGRLAQETTANVANLAEQLAAESAALLHELAVEPSPELDAAQARRILEDTLARLRHRRRRQETQALTRQMRDAPPADAAALLATKNQQLKERAPIRTAPPEVRT